MSSETVVVVSTGGTIAMRTEPGTGKLVRSSPATSSWRCSTGPTRRRWSSTTSPRAELRRARGAGAVAGPRRGRRAGGSPGRARCRRHARDGHDGGERLPGRSPARLRDAGRLHRSPARRGPSRTPTGRATCATRSASLVRRDRRSGAVVVFAGEIHAARDARKAHTSAVRAFDSPGYGPIGHIDGGVVGVRRVAGARPGAADARAAGSGRSPPPATPGATAGSCGHSLADRRGGDRARGHRARNANDQVVEAVREATARGVPVVVCSRCATGRVEPVYGRGGGRDLEEAGALFAGDLAGPKVRVLLQIALGAGLDVRATLAAEVR